MSYRALYRVWRPSRFDQLIGQETIAKTLRNALRQDRLSHAYLFTGGRGTGKTSTAKILAKAVNCLNPQDGEPCNACEHCLAINEDRYMDVIEIDAASNRGIDEMRQLKENVHFAPSQGPKKVYIIDEVHMLTTEAFNALLKTLEEPPSHVLFILATTDPQKIPATILSRTQRFDFRRIPPEAIADHLSHIASGEKISVSPEALDLIAHASDGGLRDAVSLLDQASAYSSELIDEELIAKLLGRPSRPSMQALLKAMAKKDYQALFESGRKAIGEAGDPATFLRALTASFRDLMMALVFQGSKSLPKDMGAFSLPNLEKLLAKSLEMEADLKRLPDADLIVETGLISMTLILDAGVQAQPPTSAPQPANHTPAPKAASLHSRAHKSPQAPRSESQKKPQPSPPPTAKGPAELQKDWLEIMEAVKNTSIRTHALLRQARPRSLEDGVLTLSFPPDSEFHYRQMREVAQQNCLLAAMSKVLGTGFKVDMQIESKDEPEGSAHTEDSFDIVAATKQIFGDIPMEIHEEDPFQ